MSCWMCSKPMTGETLSCDEHDPEDVVARLQFQLSEARAEIEIDNKLIAERNRVFDALPCPIHGQCAPGALQQVELLKRDQGQLAALREQHATLQSQFDEVTRQRDRAHDAHDGERHEHMATAERLEAAQARLREFGQRILDVVGHIAVPPERCTDVDVVEEAVKHRLAELTRECDEARDEAQDFRDNGASAEQYDLMRTDRDDERLAHFGTLLALAGIGTEMQRAGARAAALWGLIVTIRSRFSLELIEAQANRLYEEGPYEIGERIVNERNAALVDAFEERGERAKLEQSLRMEWWGGHGCHVAARYGDDGEMQCGSCATDFKRMPFPDLQKHVSDLRVRAACAAAAPACANHSPRWFIGRWRDWHRGHGCNLDDGKTRSPEAVAEIAKGGGGEKGTP